MGIADLGNVLKIFGGSEISAEEQQALFQEVLLMVLARASSSDTSIQSIEVRAIQEIVEREDWSAGNALALIVSGQGRRVAESYDGTAPPELVIQYVP